MERAAERVRERLLRACGVLDRASIPYAVAGGNAVAAWVSRVDEAAVRNARQVDLILRRSDFDAARHALEAEGFAYRHAFGVDMFLEESGSKARDAVHVLFAGEKVRPEYASAVPDVHESERSGEFNLLDLEALVRMKLTSFRDKDRMHLRDLIDVGLVDAGWESRLDPALGSRLHQLLADPDG